MKDKFKIIESTENRHSGKTLELSEVTTDELRTAMNKDLKVIKLSENTYRCFDEHITIIIKKEI